VRTGDKKIVAEGLTIARYAPSGSASATGHLVYYAPFGGGSLMAVPFDVDRLDVKGSPAPVLDGVQVAVGPFGAFGFSESGTLAYLPGNAVGTATSTLVWVDRKGAEQPLPAPARPYTSLRLSPDGGRAAVDIDEGTPAARKSDVWVYDLARGTLTRRTFEETASNPVWTPDGKQFVYRSAVVQRRTAELRLAPADGGGPPASVAASERGVPTSVSPDGTLILGVGFRGGGSVSQTDLLVWSLGEGASAGAKPRPFLEGPFGKASPQFSPDGRWVAYQSNESGRDEVYVVPYPGPGSQSQVSTDGGTVPRWAPSGRELFYRTGDKMMAVEVQTSPTFRAGTPTTLFEGHYDPFAYDVAPDGKRFLMLKAVAGQARADHLHVVVNWFEQLRRRAPVGK
jgi:serine/threonine-protein kinase